MCKGAIRCGCEQDIGFHLVSQMCIVHYQIIISTNTYYGWTGTVTRTRNYSSESFFYFTLSIAAVLHRKPESVTFCKICGSHDILQHLKVRKIWLYPGNELDRGCLKVCVAGSFAHSLFVYGLQWVTPCMERVGPPGAVYSCSKCRWGNLEHCSLVITFHMMC